MDTLLESKALTPGWFSYRMYHLASKWMLLLTAISFIFIGASGIWLGIASGLKQMSFVQSAEKSFGVITSIQVTRVADKKTLIVDDSKINDVDYSNPKKGDSNIARISLKLHNGVSEHFQYRFGLFEDAPKVGQRVVVYYDPNYYTDIRVGGFFPLWGRSLFFLLPGIILLLSGVTMYSLLVRKTVPMTQNPRGQAHMLSLLDSGRRLAAIALASRELGMDIAEASIYVDELQKKYDVSNIWERNIRETVNRLPYKKIKPKSEVRDNAA